MGWFGNNKTEAVVRIKQDIAGESRSKKQKETERELHKLTSVAKLHKDVLKALREDEDYQSKYKALQNLKDNLDKVNKEIIKKLSAKSLNFTDLSKMRDTKLMIEELLDTLRSETWSAKSKVLDTIEFKDCRSYEKVFSLDDLSKTSKSELKKHKKEVKRLRKELRKIKGEE